MADVNATVQNAAAGIVGVIKALIVLFVFVNSNRRNSRLSKYISRWRFRWSACFAGLSLVSRINNQLGPGAFFNKLLHAF